ncbi:MAG: hypothetical protein BECKG1743E_GA0114224_106251, partial [Candidatus Kentron sp. G]
MLGEPFPCYGLEAVCYPFDLGQLLRLIDSDPERTTITRCGSAALYPLWCNASVSGDSTPLPPIKRYALPKAISIKEYTNLLVFIVQLLRCNNSYIVNDAPAA